MLTATAVAHEFRREIPSGRAAIFATASRLLDLYHQHRPESGRCGLRGWWLQVYSIQLLRHRHKTGLDVDASWKIDALPRRTASNRRHALHYDLLCGSVMGLIVQFANYPTANVLKIHIC